MARNLKSIAQIIRRKNLWPIYNVGSMLHSHATSFGFKEVREEEKSQLVSNVFTNVASNYDLMNDIMSGGLHRLWKDRLVDMLNPFPGMKHLDVAGGTGDVAFRILERIRSVNRRALEEPSEVDHLEETQIYVCDINPNMLNVGKKRAQEQGLDKERALVWVEGDAESLNFADNSMDGYTIAFGIRNVTHIEKAVTEAYRVLKRGGTFLCLELSHVDNPIFKQLSLSLLCTCWPNTKSMAYIEHKGHIKSWPTLRTQPNKEAQHVDNRNRVAMLAGRYDAYSFSVIPAVGELVAGDRESYQYLVESIRRFPPQDKFGAMIADAGFQNVEYENLVGGVVAIHSGLKF